jgi:glutaredoxin
MESRNLPFEERDLEKDPGALPALQKAARKAGVSPASIQGSVPVIVVGDQILKGFNKGAIEKAWKGK